MANNRITKMALADGLKELLKERPLSKTTVKDITEYCDMSRNSFYYHFKDKYELISWMFYEDLSKTVKFYDDPEKLADSFMEICSCLSRNRRFYLACFQYNGQNSLFEVLHNLYYKLWRENLGMRYAELGMSLTERQLDIMSKLDAHALVGIVMEWVREGMHNNYIKYFEEISCLLDAGYAGENDRCCQMVS